MFITESTVNPCDCVRPKPSKRFGSGRTKQVYVLQQCWNRQQTFAVRRPWTFEKVATATRDKSDESTGLVGSPNSASLCLFTVSVFCCFLCQSSEAGCSSLSLVMSNPLGLREVGCWRSFVFFHQRKFAVHFVHLQPTVNLWCRTKKT